LEKHPSAADRPEYIQAVTELAKVALEHERATVPLEKVQELLGRLETDVSLLKAQGGGRRALVPERAPDAYASLHTPR
jgi:hypothetical protein